MKKYLPWVLLATLLFLALSLALLFYRLSIQKAKQPTNKQTQSDLIKIEGNLPQSPILKSYYPDDGGFMYELFGSLRNGLIQLDERQDGAFGGEFVIAKDPLLPRVQIIVPKAIIFGIYKGSFENDSNWLAKKTEDIAKELKQDEIIKIQVSYPIPSGNPKPAYISSAEDVFDSLIEEYKNNTYKYQIPADFKAVVNGIGVIR